MAYLGSKPQSGFISNAKERYTGLTTNYVDLNHSIGSLADCIVWVNYVKQDATNLTLTTSTRITLGATLVASDIVEVAYLGKAVATQTPDTGTVTNDMLAGSIDLTSKVTGALPQANIADQAINEAKLQVSNAPTNGYMLTAQSGNTGGLTWAEAPSGATAVVAGGSLTSNTSELDIQSISGYKFYTLFLNNIKSINNNYDMKMRINGYTSSTYEYFNRYYKVDSSGSNVVTQNNSGDNNWPFMGDDLGNNDDEGLSLRIDFFAGGGQTKAAWVGFGRDDNHADGHRVFGSGQVDSVGLSRIQIYSGGGNIKASGSYPMQYTLIGYNQS